MKKLIKIGIFVFMFFITIYSASAGTQWNGSFFPFDTENYVDVISGTTFIKQNGNITGVHQVGNGSFDYNTASDPQLINLTWRTGTKPLQDVKSLDFWIYFVVKATDRNIFYFSDNSDQNPYVRIWEDGSGNLEIYNSINTKVLDIVPAGQIITGKWLHVILMFNYSGTNAWYGWASNTTLNYVTTADTINFTVDTTLDDVFAGRIAGGASGVADVYIDNLFFSTDKYTLEMVNESHSGGSGLYFNSTPTFTDNSFNISLNNVSYDSLKYPLSNNSVFEYTNNLMHWNITIANSTVLFYNVSFYNNTNGLLYNKTNIRTYEDIATNGTLFRDFNNPFSLVVDAWGLTDLQHNQSSINFNMTDTSMPVCTGFDNDSVVNNTNYQWDVTCTDKSFFSLNVTCNNGFTHVIQGLDTQSYPFNNITLITNTTLCDFTYCDGHTAQSIYMDIRNPSLNSKTFDDIVTIETEAPLKTFDVIPQYDRYAFDIKTAQEVSNITFIVTSKSYIFIMPQGKYIGWLVTGDYWLDFDNAATKNVKVNRISDTEVEVTLTFFKAASDLKINSIGKLNCVSGRQRIDVTLVSTEGIQMLSCDLSSTGKALGLVGFAFMMLVIIIFCFYIKIPILDILMGFVSVYFAWYIAACFLFANFIFIIMGLILMATGITLALTNKG